MIAAFPADQTEILPLPKFEVPPNDKLLPPEIPTPESGTRMVLALVSSFHPIVTAAAAFPGDEHAVVESR